jgi:hypothetical protein
MGYRSTVAYTIRFIPPQKDEPEKGLTAQNCKATFFTFLAEAKANGYTAGAIADSEYLVIDEKELTLNFFADDVKWYESYDDVKCHEALLELSKEWADDGDCSNPYIAGAFARIGEEMTDAVEEVWGEGCYDWISIHRTMSCDWLD